MLSFLISFQGNQARFLFNPSHRFRHSRASWGVRVLRIPGISHHSPLRGDRAPCSVQEPSQGVQKVHGQTQGSGRSEGRQDRSELQVDSASQWSKDLLVLLNGKATIERESARKVIKTKKTFKPNGLTLCIIPAYTWNCFVLNFIEKCYFLFNKNLIRIRAISKISEHNYPLEF